MTVHFYSSSHCLLYLLLLSSSPLSAPLLTVSSSSPGSAGSFMNCTSSIRSSYILSPLLSSFFFYSSQLSSVTFHSSSSPDEFWVLMSQSWIFCFSSLPVFLKCWSDVSFDLGSGALCSVFRFDSSCVPPRCPHVLHLGLLPSPCVLKSTWSPLSASDRVSVCVWFLLYAFGSKLAESRVFCVLINSVTTTNRHCSLDLGFILRAGSNILLVAQLGSSP